MSTELAPRDNVVELARQPAGGLALSFQDMIARVAQVDQFYREVMQEGTDYGKIPGTDKPTLYQPGAQMLDQIFGYVPTFEVMPASVIDWARPIPFFHYVIRCRLLSRRSGENVAEGIGSCNSYEDKYRWRNAKPTCPECGRELFRSKQKPEWFCWRSKGGCGGTVALDAVSSGGRVENEETASLENTISKMAQKRAHVAATLNATGASRIFTQDIEDLPQFQQALRVESVTRSPFTAGADEPISETPNLDAQLEKAQAQERPLNRGGWTDELREKWAAGLAARRALGLTERSDLRSDAPRAMIVKALNEIGAQVNARRAACDQFEVLTKQALALGVDVDVIDPKTLTPDDLAETHAALKEMYEATLAAAGGGPSGAPDDDDRPF